MNYCSMCGAPIPDDQSVCSRCYGDPEYGHDNYYKDELEQAWREDYQNNNGEEEE